jgi:hypothetical protein
MGTIMAVLLGGLKARKVAVLLAGLMAQRGAAWKAV